MATDDIKVPEAKLGHPLMDPELGLLSEDDEKMLDPRGRQIADKRPWSQCPSGMFLSVTGYFGEHEKPSVAEGRRLPNGLMLMVAVTPAKPAFTVPYWGACLELPSDLASDEYKKTYVSEWVIDTVKEVLTGTKSTVGGATTFQAWLILSVDKVIKNAGF